MLITACMINHINRFRTFFSWHILWFHSRFLFINIRIVSWLNISNFAEMEKEREMKTINWLLFFFMKKKIILLVFATSISLSLSVEVAKLFIFPVHRVLINRHLIHKSFPATLFRCPYTYFTGLSSLHYDTTRSSRLSTI